CALSTGQDSWNCVLKGNGIQWSTFLDYFAGTEPTHYKDDPQHSVNSKSAARNVNTFGELGSQNFDSQGPVSRLPGLTPGFTVYLDPVGFDYSSTSRIDSECSDSPRSTAMKCNTFHRVNAARNDSCSMIAGSVVSNRSKCSHVEELSGSWPESSENTLRCNGDVLRQKCISHVTPEYNNIVRHAASQKTSHTTSLTRQKCVFDVSPLSQCYPNILSASTAVGCNNLADHCPPIAKFSAEPDTFSASFTLGPACFRRTKRRRRHIPHALRAAEFVTRRNDRERRRISHVNDAFEQLRGCIPELRQCAKASKISILQKAIGYIFELSSLLKEHNSFPSDMYI
ncbi:hypothetical protein Btru_066801, partial [Bulinus truncatus]